MKLLSICICGFLTLPSGRESAVEVPAATREVLEPVLAAELVVENDSECHGVDYAGRCAELYRKYEEQLYSLLSKKTAASDEAVAVLFSFYVGEHPAEELVCSAASRGPRMLPLFRKYRNCNPDIKTKYPPGMVLPASTCKLLMDEAKTLIQRGSFHSDCD